MKSNTLISSAISWILCNDWNHNNGWFEAKGIWVWCFCFLFFCETLYGREYHQRVCHIDPNHHIESPIQLRMIPENGGTTTNYQVSFLGIGQSICGWNGPYWWQSTVPSRSVSGWFLESRLCMNIKRKTVINMTGWWFGCHFWHFPRNIGNNHPNWLSYFSEGFKPPTRWQVGWSALLSYIRLHVLHLLRVLWFTEATSLWQTPVSWTRKLMRLEPWTLKNHAMVNCCFRLTQYDNNMIIIVVIRSFLTIPYMGGVFYCNGHDQTMRERSWRGISWP